LSDYFKNTTQWYICQGLFCAGTSLLLSPLRHQFDSEDLAAGLGAEGAIAGFGQVTGNRLANRGTQELRLSSKIQRVQSPLSFESVETVPEMC